MSSARSLASLALALSLLLGACGADELTELVVVVDSDLAVPTALDEVSIVVAGATGTRTTARASLDGPAGVPLPVTLGLSPGATGGTTVTIRADGLLGGVRRVSREVRTSFVENRRLVVRIALLSSCVGVVCGDGDTCGRDGACVTATVAPSTLPSFTGPLPREDLGTIDAGSDLGPPDLGPPDLGPPDLGPPIDAGPPSCDSLYGAAHGYMLCQERPSECEFYTILDGGNCRDRCTGLGGTCVTGYGNTGLAPCVRMSNDPCGLLRGDEICVCTR